MLNLLTNCFDALNGKKRTALLMVDLKQAFDTVCYQRLILKLKRYGIKGVAVEIIKSYLSNRIPAVSSVAKRSPSVQEVWGSIPGQSNRHSVANDSPPLRRFFGAVLPRR